MSTKQLFWWVERLLLLVALVPGVALPVLVAVLELQLVEMVEGRVVLPEAVPVQEPRQAEEELALG